MLVASTSRVINPFSIAKTVDKYQPECNVDVLAIVYQIVLTTY